MHLCSEMRAMRGRVREDNQGMHQGIHQSTRRRGCRGKPTEATPRHPRTNTINWLPGPVLTSADQDSRLGWMQYSDTRYGTNKSSKCRGRQRPIVKRIEGPCRSS